MNNELLFKILNFLFFGLTLGVNYVTITGIGPFKPIGNVSNTFNTTITPPNWAFSIWGLIYLGLLVFNITQFIPSLKLNNYVNKINIWFILSCVFNISWIFAFSIGTKVSILVSVFLIVGLLVSLLFIQQNCNFFKNSSTYELIFGDITFSLYLGWVMTATILNFATCINAWTDIPVDKQMFGYYIIMILAFILYTLNLFCQNNYVTTIVFLYVCISLIIKFDGINNRVNYIFTLLILSCTIITLVVKTTLEVNNKKKIHKKKHSLIYQP